MTDPQPNRPTTNANPGAAPPGRNPPDDPPARTPEPDAITDDDVRRVARLARLDLSDDEVATFRPQLGSILAHAAELRALPLEGVAPMAHPLDAVNRLDDDHPAPTLPTQTLMDLAPAAEPPFVRVPKVLGDGPSA